MCDDPNCQWRIKYFAAIKRRPQEKQLLADLMRANKKLRDAREELDEIRLQRRERT